MLLTPGTHLGAYEIITALGAGGMGEVYRAHDPRLGRDVALKILPAATANDPHALERFTREARAVAALNHPHIVTIHSTEEADGIRFMTMELIEGRTLDQVIPVGGVSLGQFFELAIAIADALSAAHQKQITHRDLKPGNVMLTDSGRVKVLDFGLARVSVPAAVAGYDATRAALTGDGTILGTTAYMSPEQIEGKPLDGRSDLFAFGVVLYELLAGERPFRGDSSPAVMAAVIKDRPKLLSEIRRDVPAGVSRVVEHCLEKNPRDRTQSAQEALLDLKALKTAWESGRDVPRSAVPVSGTRRAMWATGSAVAALLLVGVFGTRWFVMKRAAHITTEKPTVAVLPFTDMSEARDQSYFSDGVSENILTLLSTIPELRVTSRSSAFSFRGKNVEVAEIAKRLNVGHVLEGSVRKSGKTVRITVNLIDARTDTPVWSETYDRTLDDVLSVQDEIAFAVARHLRATLVAGWAARPRKIDGRAYDLYLQAMDVSRQARPDRYEQTQRILNEALAIDPNDARAWAALGSSYLNEAAQGMTKRPRADAVRLARDAANRAIAIDLRYPWPYTILSSASLNYDNDVKAAAGYLEHAIALAPNDTDLLLPAAAFVQNLGRLSEAVALREYALMRDPLDPLMQFNLGVTYLNASRFDDAIAAVRRSLAISPQRTVAHYVAGIALLLKHDATGALAEFQAEPSDTWKAIGMPMALQALGREKEANAALLALIAKDADHSSYNIAAVYALRGDADNAFRWLGKAVERHDGGLPTVPFDPTLENLRSDPRWLPFLRTLGKAPDQLSAIKFNVRVPER